MQHFAVFEDLHHNLVPQHYLYQAQFSLNTMLCPQEPNARCHVGAILAEMDALFIECMQQLQKITLIT